LAPAFEKVAGWLDKLATWVGNNKEQIGEMANKFLEWGAALAEKVWPVLKDIGIWAADHPGLFAGIVAGLAIAPTVIAGISSLSGLVTLLAGATISASVLAALGYIALIAAAGVGLKVAADYGVKKAQTYTGMGTDPNAPTDMSGQTLVSRTGERISSKLTGQPLSWQDPLNPNSPAHDAAIGEIKQSAPARFQDYEQNPTSQPMMSESRRGWFMQRWDAVWGE